MSGKKVVDIVDGEVYSGSVGGQHGGPGEGGIRLGHRFDPATGQVWDRWQGREYPVIIITAGVAVQHGNKVFIKGAKWVHNSREEALQAVGLKNAAI